MLKFKKLLTSRARQVPTLITFDELSAHKDETHFDISRDEYDAIKGAIEKYVTEGGDMTTGKIQRKNQGIKYSVNIVKGHFILSHHIERINTLESYIYRAKGDKTPLKINKNKKPMLYDAGINLNTNQILFIKEYRNTSINAQASEAEQNRQIQKLTSEHANWTAFKKPCLLWSRNNKHYLATPYVGKYDAFEWLDKGCGTYEEAVEIFCIIARKIEEKHKEGWIHCDIRLENFIPTRVNDKLNIEFIDVESFHPISKALEISEILSNAYILNPSWKSDFKVGKAKYGKQTDIYALNILLQDITKHIDDSLHLNDSDKISNLLNGLKDKNINDCYSIDELLLFADQLSGALVSYRKAPSAGAVFSCL